MAFVSVVVTAGLLVSILVGGDKCEVTVSAEKSVARHWNEALLDAIRSDLPAPTVHSRNLFHTSAAMWDAWAAYGEAGLGVFYIDRHEARDD